jgi:hypothetical protein
MMNLYYAPSMTLSLSIRVCVPVVTSLTRPSFGLRHLQEAMERPRLQILLPENFIFTHHQLVLPEVNPLRRLPRLNAQNKQDAEREHNPPLLVDAIVQEDDVVDDGDVQRGQDEQRPANDRPEEEGVAPKPVEPRARIRNDGVEEGAAGVDELPAKGGKHPHHDGVADGAGAEDTGTRLGPAQVAVLAEVAVVQAPERGDEGADHADSHDDAVDEEVSEELGSEDAVFEL